MQGCVGELSLLMVKSGGRDPAVHEHLQQVTSEFQHIAAIFCSQGPEVLAALSIVVHGLDFSSQKGYARCA